MKLARILAVASFALAGVSALAATSFTLESRSPDIAAATGFGDGFAKAKLAERLLTSGVAEGTQPRLELDRIDVARVEKLSQESYLAEPLSVAAIRNLGLLAEARGERERAASLMGRAWALSRRDLSTSSWLVRDYARQRDIENVLRVTDVALRTNNRARELLFPQLTASLSQDAVVEPLLGLLRANPNWEIEFWEQAHTVPAALPNIVKLRIQRGRDGYAPPSGYDARIMEQLVRTGQLAQASRLYDFLYPQAAASGIVRNPRFDKDLGTPPFAWEIQYDADLTARLDAMRGELAFGVYGNEETVIARQLVELPSGPLVLRAKADSPQGTSTPIIRLSCAERSLPENLVVNGPFRGSATVIRKPAEDCSFHWLEIVMPAAAKREYREGTVKELSILPRKAS